MTSGSNSTISSPEFAVKPVPTAVVLPPDFERHQQPLLISLHAGASSRDHITEFAPLFRGLFEQQSLPPLVTVGFSSGPGSWYHGNWEEFVVDELPGWMHERLKALGYLKK